jgi:hypothetical protein
LPTRPFQFRGLESNQHQRVQSPMSYRLDDPGISKLFDTAAPLKVRGEGFEPSSPGSKPGSLPLADPRECPVGIEPTCLVWKTSAFAARPRAQKAEREGVEPSRLSARPFSRRLPSPVGLPFRSRPPPGCLRTIPKKKAGQRGTPGLVKGSRTKARASQEQGIHRWRGRLAGATDCACPLASPGWFHCLLQRRFPRDLQAHPRRATLS